MAGCPLREPDPRDRFAHGTLDHGLMKVVTPPFPTTRIAVDPSGGKDVWPHPVSARARQFASQRFRQRDSTQAPR